jgi:hypothetical protein
MHHVRIDQVDRADIRIETLRDVVDDVRQRLLEIVGPGDDLGDIGEEGDAIGNGGLREWT